MAEEKEQTLADTFDFEKLSVDELIVLAETAEKGELFVDMTEFITQLVKKKLAASKPDDATVMEAKERQLFSLAYKNKVGRLRESWRRIAAEDEADDKIKNPYQAQIEKELDETCGMVIKSLNSLVDACKKINEKVVADKKHVDESGNIQPVDDDEYVFYTKMIGDYYRYLAEVTKKDDHKKNAEKYYTDSLDRAQHYLKETNPTRLGLALNFSVCYFEILENKNKACAMAKAAFDEAIEKLDSLSDESYRESTMIMQLLRDNLSIWGDLNGAEANEEDAAA